MPTLKGTEKQIQWAGQIRDDLAAAWGNHPSDTTGRVKDAASVVAGMGHAKQLIDMRDVVGDPKQLVATVARGREIAAAVTANAGKVPEKDVAKTLGHMNIEAAAVAYHLLNPDAPTYDGYGQTAAPRFKMWLTGKLPLPKGGA